MTAVDVDAGTGIDTGLVARVRRFNRTVTQRVGALQDDYLSSGRPLGEARVLWEIGGAGCDVRQLRARLGLDSGYASRLLRSLEADGLIELTTADHDRRVRRAVLTAAGAAERRRLDRRSDDLARSLLEPLTDGQRARLIAAMDEVEALLAVALLEIAVVDPGHPDAQHCLRAYYSELDRRFDTGFDPAQTLPLRLDDMRPPAGLFCVARLRGAPVGCAGLRFHGREPAEIKRMWVDPSARGLGVARRLLGELEARAAAGGSPAVRLDTNRSLTEAIALYRSVGYREVPPFNDEPYAHHWFEKRLS